MVASAPGIFMATGSSAVAQGHGHGKGKEKHGEDDDQSEAFYKDWEISCEDGVTTSSLPPGLGKKDRLPLGWKGGLCDESCSRQGSGNASNRAPRILKGSCLCRLPIVRTW